MAAIAEKFWFQYPLPSEVANADKKLLEIEWGEMMTDDPIIRPKPMRPEEAEQLRPEEAEQRFLNYFEFQSLNY
jgi:hypothetical protein